MSAESRRQAPAGLPSTAWCAPLPEPWDIIGRVENGDYGLAIAYSDRVVGLDAGRITLDEPSDGMRSGDLDALYGT